jgi:hypothetical protein
MRGWRRNLGGLLLCAAGACSSPTSHGNDAGPRPERDLGPYEVYVRHQPYPVACENDAGCPVGTRCREDGFCGTGFYESCWFDEAGVATNVTSNGDPCAIHQVAASGAASGIGMSAGFCEALGDSESYEALNYGDVFPDGCRWSDGTPVESPVDDGCYGFPAVLVQGSWTVLWSFCGGPCGSEACGEMANGANAALDVLSTDLDAACVGRSDTRAFGVCAPTARRCSATDLHDVEDCAHYFNSFLDGEERCACMFTGSSDGSDARATGWVVPRGACTHYRSIYAGDVTCRDERFELVP